LSAEADILEILTRSQDIFGDIGRQRYEALLVRALRDIAEDPVRPGTIDRPELGNGVRSFHLRHCRERARLAGAIVRSPRHMLLYRILQPDLIGIGRVLHDAMEMERHLPPNYGED
jgi:toxin ParE1/3/4